MVWTTHLPLSKPRVWTQDSTFISGQPPVSCVPSRLSHFNLHTVNTIYSILYLNIPTL